MINLQQTKLGNLMFAIGLVGGGIYAAKRNKPLATIALISVALGAGGYVLGNSVYNFYTNKI
jgi:hypothetical protein